MARGDRWLGASVAMLLTALASPAIAESAIECANVRIVEVFSGTESCPDADYVILRIEYPGPQINPLLSLDHCGAPLGSYSNYAYVYPASPPYEQELFVARSEAESLFGIDADVAAVGHVPAPDGWLEYICNAVQAEIVYGGYPGAVAPALVPGKALGWDGAAWQLVDPKPRNSSGAVGTLGACPAAPADAFAPDAASTDAATDAPKEYPPCTPGSGGSNSGGSNSGGSNSGGSNGGGAGASGDGAIGGSSGAAQDSGTMDASGGTAPSDAGTADAAQSSGCACGFARERGIREPLAAVAWLLLGALLLRKRRVLAAVAERLRHRESEVARGAVLRYARGTDVPPRRARTKLGRPTRVKALTDVQVP